MNARTGHDTAPGIEVAGLEFGFDRESPLLSDIALRVDRAEVCALLGPNGAGKTTLLRCVLGLLTPWRGGIRIAGRDVGGLSARELARLVAYVPQAADVTFPFTTLDIVVMGRTPHLGMTATPSRADRRAALDVLAGVRLDHLADRPFGRLSGGERQLALIARALVQQAPVLALDEPTSALDYGNAVHLLGVVTDLAAAGHTVLMATHQPDHALAYADQAVMMRDGRIVAAGPPARVMTGTSLSKLYGTPIHVADVRLPGARQTRACVPIVDRPPRVPPAH